MTGLMYNRPEDHITYLQDCLKTLEHDKRGEPVPWNRFIVASKPLPPIRSGDKDFDHASSRATDHTHSDSCRASGLFFYFVPNNFFTFLYADAVV